MKNKSPILENNVVTMLGLPRGDLAQNDAAGGACGFNKGLLGTSSKDDEGGGSPGFGVGGGAKNLEEKPK